MQFQNIDLNGVLRPIRFSYAALYLYEEMTDGRDILEDYNSVAIKSMEVAEQHLSGKPITAKVRLKLLVDIAFCGLTMGAKTIGKEIEFTKFDVADWLLPNEEAIIKLITLFRASFPKEFAAGNSEPDTETEGSTDGGNKSKKKALIGTS